MFFSQSVLCFSHARAYKSENILAQKINFKWPDGQLDNREFHIWYQFTCIISRSLK